MAAADPKQPGGAQCKVKVIEKPQMSEINPGVWDGLTVADAKRQYPEEWERFVKDPYTFRAPRAESYHDLSGTFFISVFLVLFQADIVERFHPRPHFHLTAPQSGWSRR